MELVLDSLHAALKMELKRVRLQWQCLSKKNLNDSLQKKKFRTSRLKKFIVMLWPGPRRVLKNKILWPEIFLKLRWPFFEPPRAITTFIVDQLYLQTYLSIETKSGGRHWHKKPLCPASRRKCQIFSRFMIGLLFLSKAIIFRVHSPGQERHLTEDELSGGRSNATWQPN